MLWNCLEMGQSVNKKGSVITYCKSMFIEDHQRDKVGNNEGRICMYTHLAQNIKSL